MPLLDFGQNLPTLQRGLCAIALQLVVVIVIVNASFDFSLRVVFVLDNRNITSCSEVCMWAARSRFSCVSLASNSRFMLRCLHLPTLPAASHLCLSLFTLTMYVAYVVI